MKSKTIYGIIAFLSIFIGFALTGITGDIPYSIVGMVASILFYMKMLRTRG